MRKILLAAAFASLAVPAGWAQDPSPKAPPLPNAILLARSWDEAIKEATIRNVPILFTTALATWGECIGALGSVHRSKIAIEASLKVVNLVGILDQRHGHTYVVVNGRKEKRCSIVPSMTCEEHFKVADYAFLNGFASATGQVFVCVFNKNGKLPNKPAGNPGGEGYVKIVEAALKKIDGFTIGKLDYDAFMAQLDAAQAARGKDLRKAIDILVKAAANPQAGLAVLAQQKMGEIDGEGFAHVDEAERLAKENPAKAKDTLKQLIAKYAPLECSKRAEAILKRINEKGK